MFKTISTYNRLFEVYLGEEHNINSNTHTHNFLLILPLMFSKIDEKNEKDLALFNNLILFLKVKKDGFETAFNNQQKNLEITKKNPSFESTVKMHEWYANLSH